MQQWPEFGQKVSKLSDVIFIDFLLNSKLHALENMSVWIICFTENRQQGAIHCNRGVSWQCWHWVTTINLSTTSVHECSLIAWSQRRIWKRWNRKYTKRHTKIQNTQLLPNEIKSGGFYPFWRYARWKKNVCQSSTRLIVTTITRKTIFALKIFQQSCSNTNRIPI